MYRKVYLDIDSNFRTREVHPNQADFIVSNNILTDIEKDIVFRNTPQLFWYLKYGDIDNDFITTSVVNVTTENGLVAIRVTSADFIGNSNTWYNGSICKLYFATKAQPIPRYKFLIKKLRMISSTDAIITLEINKTVDLDDINRIDIINPVNNVDLVEPTRIYLPRGSNIDNIYKGNIIDNFNEVKQIVKYDKYTKLATLSSKFPDVNYVFTCSKEKINDYYKLGGLNKNNNVFTGISKDLTKLSISHLSSNGAIDGIYTGKHIRLYNYYLDNEYNHPPLLERRKIKKYFAFTTTFAAVSGFTFTLTDDPKIDITGLMLIAAYEIRVSTILTYDTTTLSGTLDEYWYSADLSPGDKCYIRTAILESKLTTMYSDTKNSRTRILYMIEEENIDNRFTSIYQGPTTAISKQILYKIELEHLILPNVNLTKKSICNYPYIYVKLENVNNLSNENTLFWSNNPNSQRMMFRVPISNVKSQETSNFVYLDGSGMVQTAMFNLNDEFRFSIYLPNGELYETQDKDNFFPLYFLPELQISALFSFTQVK